MKPQLMEERGFDVYYTFPNTRSIKILKVVAGTYLGEVGAWGLELGRRRSVAAQWRGLEESASATRRDPELAALIEAAHGDERVIRVDKSPTWLEWRYSPATAERYEWLFLHEGTVAIVAAALVGERDPDAVGPGLRRPVAHSRAVRAERGRRRGSSFERAIAHVRAVAWRSEARRPREGSAPRARGRARRIQARGHPSHHVDSSSARTYSSIRTTSPTGA